MEMLDKPQADIEIMDHENISVYNANKQAVERVKLLTNSEFEQEIAKLPSDTQTFLRLVRNY